MTGRSAGIVSLVSMLLFVCSEARAEWRDWWWTQEQRAQQALDAGQAAKAAQLFSDPARRAYAEIEAGQYGSAAKRLAPLEDPDAQYNRGNALARGGDLRGALAAYDAALARAAKGSATERDARHNRDLVARQLQKQQQQQQQSGEQQDNEASAQNGEQSSSASEQKSGQQSREPSGREPSRQPASPTQQQSSPSAQEQGTNAKERDARAAGADDRAREAAGDRQPARATNEDSPPTTERALAVEQWLRQIPDDPGGLLRRKFLLEHRRKQSEAQP